MEGMLFLSDQWETDLDGIISFQPRFDPGFNPTLQTDSLPSEPQGKLLIIIRMVTIKYYLIM